MRNPLQIAIPSLVCAALILTAQQSGFGQIMSTAVSEISSETSDYLSIEEKSMFEAINHMRTDPKKYLEKVTRAYYQVLDDSAQMAGTRSEIVSTKWTYEGDELVMQSDTTYRNHYSELVRAYEDLIYDLLITSPLPPLLHSRDLYKVAQAHGMDQAPTNYVEHWDSHGRWPQERIKAAAPWVHDSNENIAAGPGDAEAILLQLMVDSGVDGYGHRMNLLNPRWQYIGCHKISAISSADLSWWIQEFACAPTPS